LNLFLEIAGMRLDLDLSGTVFSEGLLRRYRYFMRQPDNAAAIIVDLQVKTAGSEVVDDFIIRKQPAGWQLYRNDLLVDVRNQGGQWVAKGWIEDGEHTVDMVVRGLTNLLASERGLLMCHGMGITDGENSHLFLGKEGMGKSTLAHARPSGKIQLISDEIVFIDTQKQGAAGSPFMGEIYSERPTRFYPLSAIHVLQAWGENSFEQVGGVHAIGPLLQNVINYGSGTSITNAFFQSAMDIADSKGLRKLTFRKEKFWDWYEQHENL
jgi:hypothetical protein